MPIPFLPLAFVATAGLGAGLMYLFDPVEGRRRRALARDKAIHLGAVGIDVGADATRAARRVRDRLTGTAIEVRAKLREEVVPDALLVERVRAELGHVTPDAGRLVVRASEGMVTIAGELPVAAVPHVVAAARAVPGVMSVGLELGRDVGAPAASAR